MFILYCIGFYVDCKLYRIYVCSGAIGFCIGFVTSVGFKGVFIAEWVLVGNKFTKLFLIELYVL